MSSENDPRCSGQKEEIHPTAQQEVVKNINGRASGEGTSISFDISYVFLFIQEYKQLVIYIRLDEPPKYVAFSKIKGLSGYGFILGLLKYKTCLKRSATCGKKKVSVCDLFCSAVFVQKDANVKTSLCIPRFEKLPFFQQFCRKLVVHI